MHHTGMKSLATEIVRPLLDVTSQRWLDYLADKGLTYVTDSLNLLNDVKRNRLRNVILPCRKRLISRMRRPR